MTELEQARLTIDEADKEMAAQFVKRMEAVRQVAFAKEEKAAADRAVIETAENTRNLAEKMEELIAAK